MKPTPLPGQTLSGADYYALLNQLYQDYMRDHPDLLPAEGALGPDGWLTPTGLRELHEALGRAEGYTADQIILSWNRHCPDDEW